MQRSIFSAGLSKSGADCDPCGGPLEVIVHSQKKKYSKGKLGWKIKMIPWARGPIASNQSNRPKALTKSMY
jgi:hypothetical protein